MHQALTVTQVTAYALGRAEQTLLTDLVARPDSGRTLQQP